MFNYLYYKLLYQEWTTRGPDPAPEGVLSCPRSRLKKYKRRLLNDEDFMNEFKHHWTINNFATYYIYNPKQLWWQQYQTKSNKEKASKM